MSASRLLDFVISGLLLNIRAGPDIAYIVGRSVQMGWRGGAAAALGSAGMAGPRASAARSAVAMLAASSAALHW